jgi:hypothetical protein
MVRMNKDNRAISAAEASIIDVGLEKDGSSAGRSICEMVQLIWVAELARTAS